MLYLVKHWQELSRTAEPSGPLPCGVSNDGPTAAGGNARAAAAGELVATAGCAGAAAAAAGTRGAAETSRRSAERANWQTRFEIMETSGVISTGRDPAGW